MKKQHTKNNQL